MFIVFNKNRIGSYLVSLSAVACLFIFSFTLTKNNEELLETSTNTYQNISQSSNTIENELNNIGNNVAINTYNVDISK